MGGITVDKTDKSRFLRSILEGETGRQYADSTGIFAKNDTASKLANQTYGSNNNNSDGINVITTPICTGEASELTPQRIRVVMASLYLGVFLSALDNTIVSTLLPHIGSDFDELPRISWVATAYLFSCAIFQPLFGKVSDIFGRKSLILGSSIVFFSGALICGISRSVWWLVFGRLVSGIGGGGIATLASIIISDVVPLRNRALYQGTANFFYALGTAAGGIIGGFFSEHGGGWRSAFLVQLPFCLLSCFLIFFYLKLENNELSNPRLNSFWCKLKRLDWLGITTLVTFLFLFMVASTIGFSSTVLELGLICTLVLFSGGVFIYAELKVAYDPILPISLLSNRNVIFSSMANWFCMMGIMTTSYYLPIYWSSVLGMGPVEIGKRSIPSFFSIAIGSFGTGFYLKKYGKYYKFLMASCVISIFGQFQINMITPDLPVWRQYCLLILPNIGVAVLITVGLLAMTAAVRQEQQAAVTSISYAFRTTGCTLGVSIGAATFQRTLSQTLNVEVMKYLQEGHSEKELSEIIDKALHSSDWSNLHSPGFVRQTLLSCYDSACHSTFKFCCLCIVLSTLFCSMIKEYPLHSSIKKHSNPSQ